MKLPRSPQWLIERFTGLFGDGLFVRLDDEGRDDLLALPGAKPGADGSALEEVDRAAALHAGGRGAGQRLDAPSAVACAVASRQDESACEEGASAAPSVSGILRP